MYARDVAGQMLAVYERTNSVSVTCTPPSSRVAGTGTFAQKELPIYGSGRVGVLFTSGTTAYQISDHLGNVRAVVTRNTNGTILVLSYTDYYPFGWAMPGRKLTNSLRYRYGYQGQENDPETGLDAFELRMYDGRLGRWTSYDPKHQYVSPYIAMGNNPTITVDPDGGWDGWVEDELGNYVYEPDIHNAWEAFMAGYEFKYHGDKMYHYGSVETIEVTTAAPETETIYDAYSIIANRQEVGYVPDAASPDIINHSYFQRSYTNYLSGNYSPYNADAVGITIGFGRMPLFPGLYGPGTGMFGGSVSLSFVLMPGEMHMTLSVGYGSGYDSGPSLLAWGANYSGEGKPSIGGLLGGGRTYNGTISGFDVQYFQDKQTVPLNGVQTIQYGKNWQGYGLGIAGGYALSVQETYTWHLLGPSH